MKKTEAELDRLTIEHLAKVMKSHGSWRRVASRSFFAGLMTALGATLGLAIFTAALGYLLTWLGVIPGLSSMTAAIREFLSKAAFGE